MLKNSEPERLQALHQLGILNTNTSEYFDAITRLAMEMFGVAGAYISLLDGDRQWLKSTVGFCPPNSERDQTFCHYTIQQPNVLVIEDTLLDARFANNPMVTGPQAVRFYAGAPLITAEGYAIGALCVIDTSPRSLNTAEKEKLARLASLVMSHITLGRAVGHVDAVSGIPNKYQLFADLTAQGRLYPGQDRVLADIAMPDPAKSFEIIRVLGAGVYDALVREVGARLMRLFEGRAQVYHLSDARFAILSRDEDTEGFIAYLHSLDAALEAPLNGLNIPISLASFGGIVAFDLCPNSANDAPRKAAAAINQAMVNQQRWSFYSNAEDEQQKRAFRLLNDVRQAIAGNQFELFYQPKHELNTGACKAAEALLRWNHAELGPVSPAEFIPLIEKTALIGPLTHWVIHTAIRQLGEWHAAGNMIKLAINLSAYNFEEPDIVERLAATCREFHVDPRYVEIECTEGMWMEGPDILKALHGIRDLGMTLALDDFGTGYSNFAYLQKVPATVVKVDQSLIRHVDANPRDQRIVRSLIGLARELDYQVVAEGVETEQSLGLIRAWGADVAQGYHFAKPMNATAFLAHAIAHRDRHVAIAA
ncbi:EAL domain-containing protein (putative c-di-GMP-specific phosphodiesterase class I)/GGDEF domain-containing protein [Duganella sp. 1224]|uniref:sensor domain-containing phosphodiesterase n=1 Tax=Duganella sp. 1224 TaxID=2587052 RepID=UPI001838406F|nr:sensor domain-containing phosphodiesterase [Duganella sp. 1224]NYE60027.1 EAL domain-containing protein (putative c-di-GMP-specific phosphodiesterase class I)/GGDEF domain-containing protein [Duganella sp. 1224]